MRAVKTIGYRDTIDVPFGEASLVRPQYWGPGPGRRVGETVHSPNGHHGASASNLNLGR